MSVPSAIKIHRVKLGKRQEDLGKAIGYSINTVSDVEAGSKPCAARKLGPWLDFLQLAEGSPERREAALFMMPAGYALEVK